MTTFDLFGAIRHVARTTGQSANALGIDLGTTNSAIASARVNATDGAITVACLRDGEADDPTASVLVPSVVALEGDDVLVGREARRLIAERGASAREKSVFFECKNEMGLRHTYWKAPPGFETSAQIAGCVLERLLRIHQPDAAGPGFPLVVAVPASFQGSQRDSTLKAAELAGLDPHEVRLFDEPVAAFVDLLHRSDLTMLDPLSLHRLLVFDFGGGTCDIALFELDLSGTTPTVVLRGTSRYHRLGGGDIDRAIVHQVLMPQLLRQNRLQSLDLTWRDKKKEVEPRLLLVAEGLKTTLCKRLNQANGKRADLAASFEVIDSGIHRITLDKRTLWLENAVLTLGEFERALAPFLDRNATDGNSGEYFSALSLFVPIRELMERLRVDCASVDSVLLIGGSSLIPQVREAVTSYFPNARCLGGSDPDVLQGAVARGAALQALSLALLGKPLIQPVCGIGVAVRTDAGLVEMFAAGTPLPVPARKAQLAAPIDARVPLDIAVELAGDGERVLFRSTWTLPPPVRKGEPLELTISMDENQKLRIELTRPDTETEDFRCSLTSPLTHTDHAHKVRMRVLEREERIRAGSVDSVELGVEFRRLAEDYGELGQYERGIDALRVSMRNGEDDARALVSMGIYFGRLQNREREEACYRKALAIEPRSEARFNLALVQRDRGELPEALASASEAMRLESREPCYTMLKAQLLERSGRGPEAIALLAPIFARPLAPEQLNDWALSWFEQGAKMIKNETVIVQLQMERQRRRTITSDPRVGVLPALAERIDCAVRSVRESRGAA